MPDPVKRTESRPLSLRATTAERRAKTAAAATHASPRHTHAATQGGGIDTCQVVLGAFHAAPGQPSSPSPTPQPAPRGPGARRAQWTFPRLLDPRGASGHCGPQTHGGGSRPISITTSRTHERKGLPRPLFARESQLNKEFQPAWLV